MRLNGDFNPALVFISDQIVEPAARRSNVVSFGIAAGEGYPDIGNPAYDPMEAFVQNSL